MTIKSALSIVALMSGIAFSGAAYAQTMVGNNDVSEADLAVVQQHCDALALADMNSDIAGDTTPETENSADDESTGIQADTQARNTSTTVDLDTITLEDCRTAGLVQE